MNMVRNNEDRTGPRSTAADEVPADIKQMMNPMEFVAPTEFVELPSRGQGYAASHPLHGQDSIEIKFMTAKEEDILTSRTLLKKGVAIERVMQSIVKDPNIDVATLLSGDRNAILIAARASAYGKWYKTTITCPQCQAKSKRAIDLHKPIIYHGDEYGEYEIEKTSKGTFNVKLPYSKIVVECRLLTGRDEMQILKTFQDKKQKDGLILKQMERYIVSVNEYTEPQVISYAINNMVAPDARHLRAAVKAFTPSLEIKTDFECSSCGHEQELEVPFSADFFWPDR